MLDSNQIIQNSNGHLNIKFDKLNIKQIEKNINIISKYKEEWNLNEYELDVKWQE